MGPFLVPAGGEEVRLAGPGQCLLQTYTTTNKGGQRSAKDRSCAQGVCGLSGEGARSINEPTGFRVRWAEAAILLCCLSHDQCAFRI